MSLEAFFKHFEQLADAPNSVQKLRELILQLAVRGKLVPQDPNDEPAAVLLDKIEFEKRLVQTKNRKFDELLISADETPYELPKGWQWARFGEILLDIEAGTSPQCEKRSRDKGEWGVLKISAVSWDKFNPEENKALPKGLEPNPQHEVKAGDFLMSRANTSQLVGKSVVVENTPPQLLINDKTLRVSFPIFVNKQFFNLYNNSSAARDYYATAGTGTSTSMRNITREQIKYLPVPVPPLEEQKRIVAKVDSLMKLCNELEERQRERRSHTRRLNEGAIAQLLTTTTPDDFTHHWQRICNNFDLLYSLPENITQLRQAILQLAVQGKLVPQNSNDESALDLLEKIAYEKKQLVQEGRISQYKPLPKITPSEKAFSLPSSWQWARFGEILLNIEAGASPLCEKRPKQGDEWGVIKISAVSWDKFNPEENKALPVGIEPNFRYEVKKGDFLMSRANTRQLVGKSVVVETTPPRLLINDKTLRVSFPNFVKKRFFNLYNNSPAARDYYASAGTGTSDSMRNITREQIQRLPVPVPPIEEQKRIVAKVDRLMALCDRLEADLRQAQTRSDRLMETAVRQILTV